MSLVSLVSFSALAATEITHYTCSTTSYTCSVLFAARGIEINSLNSSNSLSYKCNRYVVSVVSCSLSTTHTW